ncbi:asparaginase [Bradymonas sediminis]|uniref:Asparaginase n=1 Tax=Bradymonas sediminis TaxID=1548548 RepID=A0A2Z4FKE1_9DELT|nr:asparaginase [Bradymonas sediminis]AWV89350.1 asparaginase [Bradymonas sediminis]TDP73529.1 L-asparaginase [Bradymonas sediminis]
MKRVLLLHTGGTLGMTGPPLLPDAYSGVLTEAVPELEKIAQLDTRIVLNLDSSDLGPTHWTLLCDEITTHYDDYDGFVIVHGTDTMAYTAGALAFALVGLDKPVILTGAQRPLASLRTDARRNLVDAVEMATRDVPEVAICFDGLLLRGCCSTKSNARDYRAFDSPGIPALAKLGVDIDLGEHIRRPRVPFAPDARFEEQVLAINMTPGFQPQMLEMLLGMPQPPHGVIIAGFGSGTVPREKGSLAPAVKRATEMGIEVLVITQCYGTVDLDLYQNSRQLAEAGAISGGRMTLEAAVPKLMHALALYPDPHAQREERCAYLQRNIAGELD